MYFIFVGLHREPESWTFRREYLDSFNEIPKSTRNGISRIKIS